MRRKEGERGREEEGREEGKVKERVVVSGRNGEGGEWRGKGRNRWEEDGRSVSSEE